MNNEDPDLGWKGWLVVLLVFGILAGIVLQVYDNQSQSADIKQLKDDVQDLKRRKTDSPSQISIPASLTIQPA